MAFTPVPPTAGRIREAVANTVIAGIKSWRITKNGAEIPVPHFELTADANSVVWNAFLLGLADATVDIEGWFDVDTANTETLLYVGKAVVLDLMLTKSPGFGYENLAGFVKNVTVGIAADANNPATFGCQVRLTGVVTAAESIT